MLLGACLILPVLLAVAAVDKFFLNSALQPHLGIEALLFPIFIFFFICMSHFYLESVMWKRNSPHRRYVKVA